ncbi:uncharacterized protein LOC126980943 [Eriocheir sinensis]|uniref:uncharacterized protein LOC126980943 n=1 Tax=Eriocheir sinensis TaxID=95602 RepID=UPI0021C9148F|nr:uncharacterized protein LOC126980943 [Eriocheir sinensis]
MSHQIFLIQACVTILAVIVMPYGLTHPSPSSSRPNLQPTGSTEQDPANLDDDGALQEGSSTYRIDFLAGFFPPFLRPLPPPPPPKPPRPFPPSLPYKPTISTPPVSPLNHLNEGHLDSLEFQFDFKPPDFFESSGFPRPEEEYFDGPPHHSPYHEEFPASHPHPAHHHEGPDEPAHPHHEDPGHSPPVHHEISLHSPPPQSHHEESQPPPPKPSHFLPPPHPPSPPSNHASPPRRPHLGSIPNSLYRYQVPVKDVHNPRDHIHDDLEPGGFQGLGNTDLEFIKDITNKYISSSSSSSFSSFSSTSSFSL